MELKMRICGESTIAVIEESFFDDCLDLSVGQQVYTIERKAKMIDVVDMLEKDFCREVENG